MAKEPKATISLAKVTKVGEYNSEGELINPAQLVEEELLHFKELSKGDLMTYSPHDKKFHYKFKIRGKELFIQRTNQKNKYHLNLRTIKLMNIINRIINIHNKRLSEKGIL